MSWFRQRLKPPEWWSLATPSFTHHLSHTIFVNHLCQPPSFTHHRGTLRGRRGTWWHPPSFCVVGVALGDSHLRFAWQAWHLATSSFVSRSRRTWRHPPSFCVAGVALMALRGALGRLGRRWRRGILRRRRGSWRRPPSFCVVGVALVDIHLRFAWQAWHLWHCVARLDGLVAGDAAAFCVAGVALGEIHFRFAW